jgi:hypothetical protein
MKTEGKKLTIKERTKFKIGESKNDVPNGKEGEGANQNQPQKKELPNE